MTGGEGADGRHRPAVVALGGGHGLAATLGAVRRYAGNITAVVSVADDGGSSGRLRQAMAIPPPGDLRRCISALADERSLLGAALEHRFVGGDLDGHAVGNLLIAGLMEAAGGFVPALDEVGRLVGARGRVLPAADEPITLVAETADGAEVEGQVAIQHTRAIRHLRVRPEAPATPPEVLAAIRDADQVVLGPGSLFTSVLAVVVIPGIQRALRETAARKVFVCNLHAAEAETEGLTPAGNLHALLAHGIPVDVALCHEGAIDGGEATAMAVERVDRSVAAAGGRAHDPVLLADALVELT